MIPPAAITTGVLSGCMALALTSVWARNLCLPISAHEETWQCDVAFFGVAAAYFASSFVAALLADRHKIMSGLAALAGLFVAHAWTPYFSLMFFGERWYQNKYALLFAGIPALAGVLVAVLVRRKGGADRL